MSQHFAVDSEMQQGIFFQSLGNFVLHLELTNQYSSYISINPHGVYQPGSAIITHSFPVRQIRQTLPDSYCSNSVERVADYAMFNHYTFVYTIVGQVKSDIPSGEQQNIEQMVALWSKQQVCMLSFTCHPDRIEPR